jgi:hypothetical protein
MEKPSKRTVINRLNRKLAKIGSNVPLQEWLDKASEIHPAVAKALDGWYCGEKGNIHLEVPGLEYDIWIDMGWYKVSTVARVEFAYFS